jgi:Na+-driven multidrug efflux pump
MPNFENDLSQGSVAKQLLLFSAPFLLSNFIQSLYNVADMIIVGQFCGTASLSGVNIGGQMTFIITNMVMGLSLGERFSSASIWGPRTANPFRRP